MEITHVKEKMVSEHTNQNADQYQNDKGPERDQ